MSAVLTLTMPARDLRRVVKTVAPAAERYDDSRPALNAVSITRDPTNGVEFTATDLFRLHTVQLADHVERAWVQDGSADTCAALVPAWWLRRWARERTAESGSATLTIHGDRASIAWGAESRTTTLVTGDFPDWRGKLAGGLSDAEGEVSVTSPTAIDTIGAVTASSSGVAVSSNNTWFEVTASTSQAYRGVVICPTSSDASMAASTASFDLGVGPAASEVEYLGASALATQSTEYSIQYGSGNYIAVSGGIPAGSRLAVRVIDASIATNAGWSVTLLGVPE